jgi:hypothetical protein
VRRERVALVIALGLSALGALVRLGALVGFVGGGLAGVTRAP